jgi:nitrite reductase (NADH) large subunit
MQNVVEFKAVPSIAAGVVGPTEDAPCGYTVISKRNPGRGEYRKIVLEDGVLKGFILVGDIMSSGVLMGLMRKKADVSDMTGRLLEPSFSIADIVPAGNSLS